VIESIPRKSMPSGSAAAKKGVDHVALSGHGRALNQRWLTVLLRGAKENIRVTCRISGDYT